MTALLLSATRDGLRVAFLVYTACVVSHFLLQTWFAHRGWRTSQRRVRAEAQAAVPFRPSVDVIVPVYNESIEGLERCLASLAAQDYAGELAVYVVDDGSPNRAELLPTYERYEALPGWSVLLPERNAGKRHAQDRGFRVGRGDVVVTIDSDTEVAGNGISSIVTPFREARVGAATGDVGVSNRDVNLLTRLISLRYWVAFNQERAAQGHFRSVLCCSGPFAAYRRTVLRHVWDRYTTQVFRGVPCTYGDDRHLTNLVLGEGYDALYVPEATCITGAPTRLGEYLRQQLRWNKSFYREVLWTAPYLGSRPWYMGFEVTVQMLLPFLLVLAVVSAIASAIFIDPVYVLHYAATVVVMAVLRCAYAIWRTRNPRFLLFVLYGFLHAAFLIPVRFRALSTLTNTGWGTRLAQRVSAASAG